jgi:hypothetical protein
MKDGYVKIIGVACTARDKPLGEGLPRNEHLAYLGDDFQLYKEKLMAQRYTEGPRAPRQPIQLGSEVNVGEGGTLEIIANQERAQKMISYSLAFNFEGTTMSGQEIKRESTSSNGLASLVEEVFRDPS